MLGGGLHDHLAHRHATGEEDVVKPLRQQRLVHFPASFCHGDVLRWEAVGDQVGNGTAGGGSIGGGLYDGGVAGRNGADERGQAQVHRIVPGRHDEGHAVGFWDGVTPSRQLTDGGGHPLGLRPLAQVLLVIAQLTAHHAHLAQVALAGGFVQIRLQRLIERFLMGLQTAGQLGQGFLAEAVTPSRTRGVVRPLSCHQFRNHRLSPFSTGKFHQKVSQSFVTSSDKRNSNPFFLAAHTSEKILLSSDRATIAQQSSPVRTANSMEER